MPGVTTQDLEYCCALMASALNENLQRKIPTVAVTTPYDRAHAGGGNFNNFNDYLREENIRRKVEGIEKRSEFVKGIYEADRVKWNLHTSSDEMQRGIMRKLQKRFSKRTLGFFWALDPKSLEYFLGEKVNQSFAFYRKHVSVFAPPSQSGPKDQGLDCSP